MAFGEEAVHLLKCVYISEKLFHWEDCIYAHKHFRNNFMKTSESSLQYFPLYCNDVLSLLRCCLLLHKICMQMQKYLPKQTNTQKAKTTNQTEKRLFFLMGATLKETKWYYKMKIAWASFFNTGRAPEAEPHMAETSFCTGLFLLWAGQHKGLRWFFQLGSKSDSGSEILTIQTLQFSNSYHAIWFPIDQCITRKGV